ncbi:MAG: adenylyl-sulfate reductase [Gammaproteobacteria bacterium]|nr:adenylyl-sulfate reductase [Gammaproteobacteria bacterium]
MFTSNPFAELSATLSPSVMQTYIVVMIILVAAGTIYDVLHKKSAKYFRENMRKAKASSTKKVGGGEAISMAIKTAVVDVAASGEFCNPRRRIAHLLTMYGFLAFAITTAIMVFQYPTPATPTPAILPQLWWLGALMVCLGGYWFWFFIRVDVAAEGSSPFRIMRADLFILSLLASATFALIWAYLQSKGHPWTMAAFGLHILATTLLFGSVPWSKFAHMFFKPAAAFEKRMSAANGSRSNLPAPSDQPETFGKVGHQPRHY